MNEMVSMLSVVISEVIVMDNAEISNMVGASNRVFKGSFDEKLKSNNFFIRNEVASYPNFASEEAKKVIMAQLKPLVVGSIRKLAYSVNDENLIKMIKNGEEFQALNIKISGNSNSYLFNISINLRQNITIE